MKGRGCAKLRRLEYYPPPQWLRSLFDSTNHSSDPFFRTTDPIEANQLPPDLRFGGAIKERAT